jgi:hypothetical protein
VSRSRDAWDRFVASDPGLNRLRRGSRAVLAVGTTIGIQLLVAQELGVTGAARILHLLLGSLLAMNMATVIRQGPRRETAVTAAWAPAVAGADRLGRGRGRPRQGPRTPFAAA